VTTVHHRYASVEGRQLFYREADPAGAPALVLLHGFPASSFMFRDLIPALADEYHVIAPDLLSFGARAFATDAYRAEIHQIDGGHFLLESQLDATVGHLRPFLERSPS
jgi:pimeloyl-ACP methyl ester carboxylesterase